MGDAVNSFLLPVLTTSLDIGILDSLGCHVAVFYYVSWLMFDCKTSWYIR